MKRMLGLIALASLLYARTESPVVSLFSPVPSTSPASARTVDPRSPGAYQLSAADRASKPSPPRSGLT